MTSNAFAKSTKKYSCKFIVVYVLINFLSTNVVSVVWHEWCSLNPDWLGCISSFVLRWDERCLLICFF